MPTGFCSQKLWGLIFPALEPWAVWSGLQLGLLTPKVMLPTFIHHTWMWDHLFCHHHLSCHSVPHPLSSPFCPISASPALICIWMTAACLNPWLSDFHTVWISDSSGYYLLWDLVVILFMVVQGGKIRLPMPPSWPEILSIFSNAHQSLYSFHCKQLGHIFIYLMSFKEVSYHLHEL